VQALRRRFVADEHPPLDLVEPLEEWRAEPAGGGVERDEATPERELGAAVEWRQKRGGPGEDGGCKQPDRRPGQSLVVIARGAGAVDPEHAVDADQEQRCDQ
jgi:hypothetical protein